MTSEELKKIHVEPGEKSTVKITGEIPFSVVEKHRGAALKAIGKDMDMPGFRKGHIPENILIQKVGEMNVLSEMAERALYEAYAEIVKEHKLDAIGYPQIQITKIAKDNPLGFTATVAVVPPVTLPDYEKLAKEVNANKESKEVTEEEVEKQVNDILRQKVAYERMQSKAQTTGDTHTHDHDNHANHEGHNHDHGDHGEHDHVHHDHSHDDHDADEDKVKEVNIEDREAGLGHDEVREGALGQIPRDDKGELILPELTDEYVKTLGKPGQFETVSDFKTKLKEHLAVQKVQSVDSAHRAKITDAIIEKTTVEIPQIMIDGEMNQMFAQMEDDLTRAQLKIDDYLGHIKKTKEDLKKEWTPSAEKRAKLQLVLNAIAERESIKPDPSLVDQEVSRLLEQYKDADEKRVRVYVESILMNDAVMKKLEEIN